MKRFWLSVIITCLMCNMLAFAAPESIETWEVGNSTDLITITNPSSTTTSSFEKTHTISGQAKEGVFVSLYILENGSYKPFKVDGNPYSWTTGASGLFAKPVALSYGKSSLLLRAFKSGNGQEGDKVQLVKFDITVLSSNIFNLIRGFKIDFFKSK